MPRMKQQFESMRNTTKEKIIKAGLQLFSHKGLAATNMQDIASLAGISVGLIYHYYKSKEELFTELVENAVSSAADSVRLMFSSDHSPAEKIRMFSKEVLESIGANDQMSQLYLLMIHYTLAVDMPDHAAEIQEKGIAPLKDVKRVIAKGQKSGEVMPGNPDEMVVTYFAAIQGLAISKLILGDQFALPDPGLLNRLLLPSAEDAG